MTNLELMEPLGEKADLLYQAFERATLDRASAAELSPLVKEAFRRELYELVREALQAGMIIEGRVMRAFISLSAQAWDSSVSAWLGTCARDTRG